MPLVESDPESLANLMQSYGIHKKITDLLFEVQSLSLKKRIVMHAFAGICFPPVPQTKLSFASMAGGRTFSISAEACATWHVLPSPIIRLIGGPRLVFDRDATAYWIKACAEAGAKWPTISDEPVFPNPDASESFFVSHFLQDIPDEWSAEERAKSHGQAQLPFEENPWASEILSYVRR